MKKKIWIVTYVDHNCNSNGKAGVVGTYLTKEKAQAALRDDIENWRTKYEENEGVAVDFVKMVGWFDCDPNDRCEWNITEDEIDLED